MVVSKRVLGHPTPSSHTPIVLVKVLFRHPIYTPTQESPTLFLDPQEKCLSSVSVGGSCHVIDWEVLLGRTSSLPLFPLQLGITESPRTSPLPLFPLQLGITESPTRTRSSLQGKKGWWVLRHNCLRFWKLFRPQFLLFTPTLMSPYTHRWAGKSPRTAVPVP